MTDARLLTAKFSTRRRLLKLGAGLGASIAIRNAPAIAATGAVLTRAIPRSGERLAVVGLGTAIIFDIGDDAAKRTERRAVIANMLDGGGRVIDTAPSYGTAECQLSSKSDQGLSRKTDQGKVRLQRFGWKVVLLS